MNLYFLVEGASTEKKFYPALIDSIFGGELTKVPTVDAVNEAENSFYILSANGYPQIYTHILKNSIEDVNQYPLYNYLFVCLDADELTVEERIAEFNEVYDRLAQSGTALNDHCEIVLIIQQRCIETWFLGNKKFYKRNSANSEMLDFHFFYNVKTNDPELMGYAEDYETHASYHYAYLKKMVSERRQVYSKKSAQSVCDEKYIAELINRNQIEKHMDTFGLLLNKLLEIKERLHIYQADGR